MTQRGLNWIANTLSQRVLMGLSVTVLSFQVELDGQYQPRIPLIPFTGTSRLHVKGLHVAHGDFHGPNRLVYNQMAGWEALMFHVMHLPLTVKIEIMRVFLGEDVREHDDGRQEAAGQRCRPLCELFILGIPGTAPGTDSQATEGNAKTAVTLSESDADTKGAAIRINIQHDGWRDLRLELELGHPEFWACSGNDRHRLVAPS